MADGPNEMFIIIENIKRTQEEIRRNREAYSKRDRQRAAARTSAALLKEGMSRYPVGFSVSGEQELVEGAVE